MSGSTFMLSTIKGGALEERFQRELERVLANIADPNTSRETGRAITIQLVFKPADDRQYAAVTARVTSKLAPDRPLTTFTLFEEQGDGLRIAVEQVPRAGEDPRQVELAAGGEVTPITRKPRKPRR